MSTLHLDRNLNRIRLLLLSKKALRHLLRAAWVGTAGFLAGWGLNSLYGILPGRLSWYLLGGFMAGLSLLGLFLPRTTLDRLVWRLDQAFKLDEQLSTGLMITRSGSPGLVAQELVRDAVGLLGQLSRRIMRRGWDLTADLEASLIIASLAYAVTLTGLLPSEAGFSAQELMLPALGKDPSLEEIFPDGNLWAELPDEDTLAGQEEMDFGDDLSQLAEAIDSEGLVGMAFSMFQMGGDLSKNSETSDLGRALQSADLPGAAKELAELAEHAQDLSQDARQALAEGFEAIAEKMDELGMQALGEIVQESAQTLAEGSPDEVQTAIEDLSAALDALASQAQALLGPTGESGPQEGQEQGQTSPSQSAPGGGEAGSGEGAQQAEPDEPFKRIQGEGEKLELGSTADQGGGQVVPGVLQDQTGDSIASGSYAHSVVGDISVVTSTLDPASYPWEYRNVVSSYFWR